MRNNLYSRHISRTRKIICHCIKRLKIINYILILIFKIKSIIQVKDLWHYLCLNAQINTLLFVSIIKPGYYFKLLLKNTKIYRPIWNSYIIGKSRGFISALLYYFLANMKRTSLQVSVVFFTCRRY